MYILSCFYEHFVLNFSFILLFCTLNTVCLCTCQACHLRFCRADYA